MDERVNRRRWPAPARSRPKGWWWLDTLLDQDLRGGWGSGARYGRLRSTSSSRSMCSGWTAGRAVVRWPQWLHNGDSMYLLRSATLSFPARQKQGCRGGSVARKSRKIGQRWFHIPLLHYKSPLSRIAMGALDGGLDIPLSDKRFAGFKKDEKQLDTEIHRNYIYEDHVADYMKSIADEEPEKYQLHFSEYIKKGIAADDMEALYKKVHAAIRADPTMAKSTKEPPNTHKRYNFKKH
ncbi:hypothetical protein ACQJBY_048642 [Aegilops geniculata]